MSYDGYMCLGGVEVINASRLAQLIGSGRGPAGIECRDCGPCPDLDLGLGYLGGYGPGQMPWYDPLEPDSNDVAGLLVTSITGLEPGAFTRPVTEAAGVGAVIGQGRQVAPVITVTGLIMASTCCASDYFLRWLRQALRGACGAPCGTGADLSFLACEPEFRDADCVGNAAALAACIAACGGNAECEADCQAAFDPIDYPGLLAPYFRAFKNAALISGPTVTQIIPFGCPSCYECGMTEVQFVISAGDPCIYRDPVIVADSATFTCSAAAGECIEWITNNDDSEDCSDDCPPAEDCATDPNCQDVSPPSMPSIPNNCVYECIGAGACQVCFDIPRGIVPMTTEGAVQLNIFSGDAEMRRINIRIWENPLDLPADELEDCDICSELNVSYVAPESTLIIDSAARTATITCPLGTSVRANPFIANGQGSASFSYPVIEGCSGPYTICVTAATGVSSLAFVTASVVAREC